MKVQELSSPPRASQVMKECSQACMKTTYQFLFDHCYDLYSRNYQEAPPTGSASTGLVDNREPAAEDLGPSLRSLDFWHKLVALIVSVIEEDRNSYAPVLNQFPQDFNICHISSECLWNMFGNDLLYALQQHQESLTCKSSDYMNLCFKVKWFWNSYVAEVPSCDKTVPDYPK